MKQFTTEQAIALYHSKVWENWTDEQIVRLQLFQDKLCVSFSVFHKAMEIVLDRPVLIHEFGFRKQLIKEYLGIKNKPTFDEILNLIPEYKRLVIGL